MMNNLKKELKSFFFHDDEYGYECLNDNTYGEIIYWLEEKINKYLDDYQSVIESAYPQLSSDHLASLKKQTLCNHDMINISYRDGTEEYRCTKCDYEEVTYEKNK